MNAGGINFWGFVAVGAGAAAGAWLRWLLGLRLNPIWPNFPLGTLSANLIGVYLIGLAIAALQARPELPPEVRLLIVTGFLGGLTTFSTYSAEVVHLLQRGQYASAAALAAVHLAGSLLLTVLGFASYRVISA